MQAAPAERQEEATGLRQVAWKRFLRGPDAELLEGLYIPALCRAVRYDRCCAYFSSQVLAVAARGFGGFIQNLLALGDAAPRPAARLLVNEQLDAQDVEALLCRGDGGPLVERLLRRFKTPQNALEKNRLAMLSWLVARGWLEVRVGIMRHGQGIPHAKFGLIVDRYGDCLAFAGSGNETGHALVANYEEVEVHGSWQDPAFVDYYRQRFERLWDDQDEHVATVPLPEAVRLRLIKLAPTEPPREMRHDRARAEAAMLWQFLAAAPYLPNGDLACDAGAMVDLWPHQRKVVADTARAFPAGRLLCDEVGMGKTVEAIMVLRRLLAGRGARRALLLVPAGLLRQWQEELREKGGLLVPIWDRGFLQYPDGRKESMEPRRALSETDVVLLSREWARLRGNREFVLDAPPWDLVVLDEAHAARRSAGVEREFNSGNLLLQLLRELQLRGRTRGILLLSATPMQTEPWEPWDLLTLLGVGRAWAVEFADIRAYYEGIAALKRDKLPDANMAERIARLVADDEEFPPGPDGDSDRSPRVLKQRLLFCGPGEPRQKYAQWLQKGAPLGRRMHRNTRETLRQYHAMGLLAAPPPRRQVEDVVFDYQHPLERECYEAITAYMDRRYEELEREKTGKGFVMTVYRRRGSSSPLALKRSLERRRERLEALIQHRSTEPWLWWQEEGLDPSDFPEEEAERIDAGLPSSAAAAAAEREEILSLLSRLEALGNTDSKLETFWQVLNEVSADGRSVLVFTEYTDTMEYLRDQLRPTFGKTLGCFSGDGGQMWDGERWVPVSKAEIADALADGTVRVLICTDAASEGLNLQAAGALINYDLPWNPSKVEQRIGRIDRIGQVQPVLPIRNLFLANSVDMRVYQVLKERCGLFTRFVGHMQPVLALARSGLREGRAGEAVEQLVRELIREAEALEKDAAVANAFVESEAERTLPGIPPARRQHGEEALKRLSGLESPVRARRAKGAPIWTLQWPGRRSFKVTTDRETLERDPGVTPLALGSPVLAEVAERLALPGETPLVVSWFEQGAFRCAEVRWVGADRVFVVESVDQLCELVRGWDGSPPPAGRLAEAEREARQRCRERVREMWERTEAMARAALERQVDAARRRLRRELSRTLLCLGSGDLNETFKEQVRRETSPDGRYRKALRLLGGYPQWTEEERADAKTFVGNLKEKERRARVAGSEIDAALNDPRWQALSVLQRERASDVGLLSPGQG